MKRTNDQGAPLSHNKHPRSQSSSMNTMLPTDKQLVLVHKIKLNAAKTKTTKLSKAWYVHWEGYCLGVNNKPPPPVSIASTEEYIELPIIAITYFKRWYGMTPDSEAILRDIAQPPAAEIKTHEETIAEEEKKKDDSDNETDGSMLRFKIYTLNKPVDQFNFEFSLPSDSTVAEFQSTLLNALGTSSGTAIELWLLNKENSSFQNALNSSAFIIVREVLDNSTRFAEKVDTSSITLDATIASCLSRMSLGQCKTQKHTYPMVVGRLRKKSLVPSSLAEESIKRPLGLSGLQNLGNTCYMNSALQCLSNTPQLTQYFLNGRYKLHINSSNPLGLNGDLAESYASLLRDLWKPLTGRTTLNRSTVSPREFKKTFEEFNPHFAGFQQHDSQEFLSFLLDGLHEDLNRIIDKPYIEIPDFDDTLKDNDIANRFWEYHNSRNDSIIVDLFQGQYKSRLVCEECKKVRYQNPSSGYCLQCNIYII